MLNTTEFAKRLQIILQEYELTAAGFAQKIEVGRASISHILSGRNKPSLDFVMKVIHTFPEVDLYWLLNGKGSFPKTATTPLSSSSAAAMVSPNPSIAKKEVKIEALHNSTQHLTSKTIDKIVIFYSDGSFEPYTN